MNSDCSCEIPDARHGTREMAVERVRGLVAAAGGNAVLPVAFREIIETRAQIEKCCSVSDYSVKAAGFACPGSGRVP